MKTKHLKSIWKLAALFWQAGFYLWITYTIIFLLIEGWHLKATNPIEIRLDQIVHDVWTFALNLTITICVLYIVNLIFEKK